MTNRDIADAFDEIADLLEIEEANPFRIRAYRNAARMLRGLRREIGGMIADGQKLTDLPGIGEDLAQKIEDMLATGHLALLDRLHQEVPASLTELLHVPGLGPKRANALYHELGVESVAALRDAAAAGRLRKLAGFGPRTEATILAAVSKKVETERRWTLADASAEATALVDYLKKVAGVGKVVVAGSFRRGRETVGDLDILVTARSGSPVIDEFTRYGRVQKVLARGDTKAAISLRNGMQVDLRVVAANQYGAALYYFTGSKAHNIAVRRLAQRRGLKINEYGVFRGTRRIAGDTEESVVAAVGLPLMPPELREDRGEIDAGRAGKLPKLITLDDIRGDLHCHTDASDGHASLRDMAEAARERGFEYLAITDHSRRLTVAHGLDERRLAQQGEAIDRLNARLSGITVLKGIEVDILEDGSLDLPDGALRKLDLVIGAVHSHFDLPPAKQTARILRALDRPCFTVLAHPLGRLLGERDAMRFDVERIIAAVKARGCFLELDAQPERLDLPDVQCRMARDAGVRIAISSDAHDPQGLDVLQFGVLQARRGWLERADVLNALPLARLRPLLQRTMG